MDQSIALPGQVLPQHLFILPTPGPVFFPGLTSPAFVWQHRSIATIEESLRSHQYLGWLVAKEESLSDQPKLEELYATGVVAKILKRIKLPDGSVHVLLQGIKRFRVRSLISEDPHLVAEAEYIEEDILPKSIETDAWTRQVLSQIKALSETHPFFSDEMRIALANAPHVGVVVDLVAFALGLQKTESQQFLETVSTKDRLQMLQRHLQREQEVTEVQRKINDEVNHKVNALQREFFLKEQLKLIKKELGLEEEGKAKSVRTFRERIAEAKMPADTEKLALEEVDRFETLNETSPDYNVARNYLETLCALPWNHRTEDQLKLEVASSVLNEDHSGLEKVKARILEFIAVRNLLEKKPNASKKGSILLLVGPPGVGKTSIGKSIAKAMNRNFYRFSLGGMRDEAEIKGHRRTYVGAMPGKFIQAAKRAGSKNAVILLDEIDKLADQYRGDPASALLEVLDPEQNAGFLDHYLDVPFDLSEMIFICTANSTATIPAPLLDRMEMIELTGYTLEEKEQIAKKHLLPKVLKKSGLGPSDVRFDRKIIRQIVLNYAREPGLRILEQQLEKISRKIAAKFVERQESREKLKTPLIIAEDQLLEYLGPKRYTHDLLERIQTPGMMVGLAWTSMGGEILFIEAAELPGTGQLKLTGQMGSVMNESAQIAWTVVKKRLIQEMLISPKELKERDIHLHLPAGAIPKDGPSAGITMASALYSLFSNQIALPKTAMTGELSLTGKVLPIGGVREKLLAARRSGVTHVILPKENQKDLHDLPLDLLKDLDIQFVSQFDEVLAAVLPKKSAHALARAKLAQARLLRKPNPDTLSP